MAIYDTYSRRQKRLNQTKPDVFVYDELPPPLRVQISKIWENLLLSIQRATGERMSVFAGLVRETILMERGIFGLTNYDHDSTASVVDYFINAKSEDAIDALEIMFARVLDGLSQVTVHFYREPAEKAFNNAVNEVNQRLLQHGIGLAFIGPELQLIRRDSEHLHKEAVIPALTLLAETGFAGANDEYRKAHEHYRHDRIKECLNECLKAFESTMKAICIRKNWVFEKGDTAKKLIDVCLKNGLLPKFMESHLAAVRSSLESAIPTVRNKLGGHGQGHDVNEAPEFFAEYLLHETAVTIVFLVNAFKAL
ncbi:STM4504/CBY_0614 family protein [Acidicapsa dinghuensis]|uniref:STM4504/CBY_0614 family protein n=1 Tax=Acidicapsa dinghuensis TaxID=2218256 RepID=A0ABW1EKS3_9BACT|nr:hypothetical protein [Acidicapsa dinghuensis]